MVKPKDRIYSQTRFLLQDVWNIWDLDCSHIVKSIFSYDRLEPKVAQKPTMSYFQLQRKEETIKKYVSIGQ